MNREEALQLAKELYKDKEIAKDYEEKYPGCEILPIPKGNQPNIEILEIIRFISYSLKESKIEFKNIVIKLDQEGACLYVNQQENPDNNTDQNSYNTFFRLPETPLVSDGIAAGDFFNAKLLLSYLFPVQKSFPDSDHHCLDDFNLHHACIKASSWLKYCQKYWTKDLASEHKSDLVKPYFLEGGEHFKNIQERQKKNWDESREFKLKDEIDKLKINFRYSEIVTEQPQEKVKKEQKQQKKVKVKIDMSKAKGFLEEFVSTDLRLRKDIGEFVEDINEYIKLPGETRPLNCLVIAEPGSGKSFFAEQVAKVTECEMKEFNCSQALSPKDLLEGISELQNVKGKTPLLFLDEVDTDQGKYYPYLLAPLWDASVLIDGKPRKWTKKFVSILVASNVNSAEEFLQNLRYNTVPKSLDLLSRLNGPKLTLSEQEPPTEEARTSRVYLTISLLLRYHDTARLIERGLLDLVYCAPKFNPRAVEHFVTSLPAPIDGIVRLENFGEEKLEKLKEFAESLHYDVEQSENDLTFIYSKNNYASVSEFKSLNPKIKNNNFKYSDLDNSSIHLINPKTK